MKKIWLLVALSFGWLACSFPTFAKDRDLPWIDLITRSERGADESIRFRENYPATPSTPSKPLTEAQKKAAEKAAKESAERATFMKANYLNDWSYSRTKADLDGHTLLYPDQIQNNKTKLVIHHTAMAYDTNRNQEQIKQHLQHIYTYHTLDRDFGDIGYNFLIDHLGNIYEGRAGGEGAVGMHVAYNNVASLGISLMGNFEETQPTQAQLDALTDLLTALASKYHIDPTASENYFQTSSTAPYVTVKKLPTIVGHKDIAATACPGKFVYSLLPFIRTEVAKRLKGETPSEVVIRGGSVPAVASETTDEAAKQSTISDFSSKLKKIQETQPALLKAVVQLVRSRYQGILPKATTAMNKLAYNYDLEAVKRMLYDFNYLPRSGMWNDVIQYFPVLLYELTTQYDTFDVLCESGCWVYTDNIWISALTLEKPVEITVAFTSQGIQISGRAGTTIIPLTTVGYLRLVNILGEQPIAITNYNRTSYAWIPRNTFRGSLLFQKGIYQTVSGEVKEDYLVINELENLDHYLKGIVETNDTEHLEKNKVIALLAKNYLLFYLNKQNVHPSIPANASYVAIDSPEMFQKYVGAGAEKTLTKRYQALEETKNQVVMYSWTLPILPYFSCSAGFTLSAEEKRGWKDTPYLQSVFDFAPCSDFQGHGVGLAGKGAEYFAQKGMKAEEILQWYYPWVEVVEV